MIQGCCITSIFYETLDFPHSFGGVYRRSVRACEREGESVCERNSAVSQHRNGIQAQREAKVSVNV